MKKMNQESQVDMINYSFWLTSLHSYVEYIYTLNTYLEELLALESWIMSCYLALWVKLLVLG